MSIYTDAIKKQIRAVEVAKNAADKAAKVAAEKNNALTAATAEMQRLVTAMSEGTPVEPEPEDEEQTA